ncbi:MAG: Nitrogen fixation regulation protein FixK [Candidatus Accumulibacter sp. SK-11]|nr:MAG: Nitrogen fixation regulation protein FixK [Candidatus Accumulibacter sp. SK-11]HCV13993.1 Crp/Fnr family transcriptional regulator [Accumulibacter sp.]
MKPEQPRTRAADEARRGRSPTAGDRPCRVSFARGQRIYSGAGRGSAWRVLSGSIRLDREEPTGEQSFSGLAVRGDIIGAETLLFERYSFSATALADCVLVPWPETRSAAAGESLLRTFAKAERRAAEVIALRCGQAAERVRRLVLMLAQAPEDEGAAPGELQVVLPSRQDMAEITALTLETVSRMVSQLRQAGMLAPQRLGSHFSQRRFSVRAPAD